ncbi:MAG: carboxypeptidase-like regulatory domain-containing protein [Bacteroidota bacterium]|nr:carboxypeptidase-like regulatory domain-containing protein [Bacteroidota bacterium]
MKKACLILIMYAVPVIAFCQSIIVKGVVKDGSGTVVPEAFIREAQLKIATYADSSGNFMIKVDPKATLVVVAQGYNDAEVKVDNKSSLTVTLAKGTASSASNTSLPAVADNNPDGGLVYLSHDDLSSQSGSTQRVKEGFSQEATRGNPYMLSGWAHGYAFGTDGKLLYDVANLYNYDKITGQLVFTKDKASLLQVNKGDVKEFFLFDGKLLPHIFEKAPVLGDQAFVEVMVTTPKYRLYKQTTTKLVRADYHNNGVIESGHKYDEYVDYVKYYFLKVGDAKAKSISLKKKAIKEAFAGDADKFIDAQGSRDIDDDYLRELNSGLQ